MSAASSSRGNLQPMLSPAFVWPVQIYWEDTDAGGVVYHSNYLKFFERARTEWPRSRGVVQTELATQHQVVFVLRSVQLQYLKPAHMDDQCLTWLGPKKLGRASLSVVQELRRGADILCRAEIELACVRCAVFTPTAIPPYLYELLAREQSA